MKQLMLFLLVASAFLPGEANLAGISKALGDGDATALGVYFDESVEVTIVEQSNPSVKSAANIKAQAVPKAQAVAKVQAFFQSHPAKSFNQIHKGSTQSSDSQYCIGDLVTSDAKFRVYIYMKNVAGKTLIQELGFNQE